MCSCDTSSGRTVSAQRQAAFSSCSRGAMVLTEIALEEPGGLRRRLRLRPNGHRHLPAERTKRCLQPEDQSITCARHSRRDRPRPACTTSRKAHRLIPDSPRACGRWRRTPCRSLRMRAPRSPCAESPCNSTGGRKQSDGPKEACHVFFPSWRRQLATLHPPSSILTSGSLPLLSILPL